MAIRGKNKNQYDDLVGFCTVNRIGAKEEMRLRGIIDRIVESKLHQPTVISSVCEHPLFLPYTPIDGNEIKQCANCGYIKQTDL